MTEHDKLGPPPVDPLSDVAWARVERRLWARVEESVPEPAAAPRSWRWAWIAAPMVAAAAVIALVIGLGGHDPVQTAHTTDGDSPARIVSGASASSITFGDAHVTLDAESAVVMSRDTQAPSALLERGAAWFAVAPRTGRPFVVVAGDTVVRVIGTRFRVGRSQEQATVEVERGLVDVTFQGITVQVSAGQVWSSTTPSEVRTDTKTAQLDPTLTADPTARPEPTLTPDTVDADLSPLPPVPADPTVKQKRGRTATKSPPSAKTAKAAPAPSKTPPVSQVDVAAREYQRLAALEVRDPSAAITGYVELARSPGAWAAPALFAAGRLAADRRDPRATNLLSSYLRRFPRGANADDVRQLLAR